MKVAQFGEGNFLRSFADVYFSAIKNCSVTIIKPRPGGSIDRFVEQNNVYHVVSRGIEGGKAAESVTKVTCIEKVINPFVEPEPFFALARDPELKIVVSNTTEAGIRFDENENFMDGSAVCYPAKLTEFLFARFESQADGVFVLPCELIDDNADKLKGYVTAYAEKWKLGEEFLRWLNDKNYFVNTLVDRIVSGYPKDKTDEERIFSLIGQKDALVSVCEPFGLWVIENKGNIYRLLPVSSGGVTVEFTASVKPYKKRKVRILNGSHTNLVPAGLFLGAKTVRECMESEKLKKFVVGALEEEIVPLLEKEIKPREFASDTINRFSNPYLNHMLCDIALNSLSKWKTRVLPSFSDYYSRYKVIPKNLTVGFTYLVELYKSAKIDNGEFAAYLPCGKVRFSDDKRNLGYFAGGATVSDFMGDETLWGENLRRYDGFLSAVESGLKTIENGGSLI